MKRNIILVMALALLACACVAIYLGGCSEEKSSNPVTSVTKPANQPLEYFRDSLTTLDPSMYEDEELEGKVQGESQALYSATQWHSFSQSYRNQLIFDKAMAENGWSTSYNCKTWAQHIVFVASGCITLPLTAMPSQCPRADGYVFCPSSDVRIRLQNQSANPSMFQRGNVMQMWYNGPNNPHTAFIHTSDAGGITFIDCNFVGAGKVGTHWMSWSTFYSRVPAYTLYEVL